MSELTRFGVSLEEDLLQAFDKLCERRRCPSRSEALRDMIRRELGQEALETGNVNAAGVLTLVYDHHVPDLSHKLTERQHDAHDCIIATMHVHLDHHNCLEMLVLRGPSHTLRELADQLRAIRGVKQGSFSLTPLDLDY